MNLLDQKLEEKLKLLEEFDNIFSNYQPKMVPLQLSKKNFKDIIIQTKFQYLRRNLMIKI